MASGERLRFFRSYRGLTMKSLGMMVGFTPNTADIRISQYESNARTPRPDIRDKLADALDISPNALDIPDIDSFIGLSHTFFALEDMYHLVPIKVNGTPCLVTAITESGTKLETFIRVWADQTEKLINGEITRREYDEWRYHYPTIEPTPDCDTTDLLAQRWKALDQTLREQKLQKKRKMDKK